MSVSYCFFFVYKSKNCIAPEVLCDQGYDGKKADVWSIGVILYVLLAGFLPFDESTIANLFNKIKKAEFTYPSWFSPQVKSVIDAMLVAEPKVRITLTQLKEHPWLLNSNPNSIPVPITTATKTDNVDHTINNNEIIVPTFELVEQEQSLLKQTNHTTTLNAFDLVSKSGGFLFDRLFSPDKYVTDIQHHSQPTTLARTQSGILKFGNTIRNNYFKFTSKVIPNENLLNKVTKIFVESGFSFEHSNESSSITTTGSINSAKGVVSVIIEVNQISSTLSLLEIMKGKGDLLEWNKICKDIIDHKLTDMILKPPAN